MRVSRMQRTKRLRANKHGQHGARRTTPRRSRWWRASGILLLATVAVDCGGDSGSADPPGDPPPCAGAAGSDNPLVSYYVPQSMLCQGENASALVSGSEEQWAGHYEDPQPKDVIKANADLLETYPFSYLPEANKTVMASLGSPALWDELARLGVTVMHPITFEHGGRLAGMQTMVSTDGGFDRISTDVEPKFGTEDDVRALSMTAKTHGAIVAGDIIPLHTGLGADFRLAEMNYGEYPGIYNMIEIPQNRWNLLPSVPNEWDFAVIKNDQAEPLVEQGVLPGRLRVLLDAPDAATWSGWAATGQVQGADGLPHRWAFAHLFMPTQPMLNWTDPTYTGRRVPTGDAVRNIVERGFKLDRLDAVPFLGLDPMPGSDVLQESNTKVAINGTEDLAFTHRKLGAHTYVELNVPIDQYGGFTQHGADLGFDFFTRAESIHPLIKGDARVLRIAAQAVQDGHIDSGNLIHAMQIHDEITYQLVSTRALGQVKLGDEQLSGSDLADRILKEMQTTVGAAPYNRLYRPAHDGVATTFVGFIGPALGIDPFSATPDEVQQIKRAHLLLGVVTAMQPGLFSISEWDLVGALPIDISGISPEILSGDIRWINRGGVDLMGTSKATGSVFGIPKAGTLYGPLPQQLADPSSFASQMANVIHARKRYEIAQAAVIRIPDIADDGVYAMVMGLPSDVGGLAITVGNYGRNATTVTIDLNGTVSGGGQIMGTPHDIVSDQDVGTLSNNQLTVPIDGLAGRTVVIGASPRTP